MAGKARGRSTVVHLATFLVLGAALAATGCIGAFERDVVSTRRIELLDDYGRVRLQAAVDENGATVLDLRDSRGTRRIGLHAGGPTGAASAVDPSRRAFADVDALTSTGVTLYDEQGRSRAEVTVAIEGSPALALL